MPWPPQYNGCKWRGQKLRVEMAKPHFLVRLQQEWHDDAAAEAAAAAAAAERQQQQHQQQPSPAAAHAATGADAAAHLLHLTVPGLKRKVGWWV